VAQEIAPADLLRKGVRMVEHTFTATAPVAALTLPERRIQRLLGVSRGGAALAAPEYAWAPESNWVSLARPLARGDSVTVRYEVSPVQDLVEAVWNPQTGNDLYLSFLAAQPARSAFRP
jgi:hypothetical protein